MKSKKKRYLRKKERQRKIAKNILKYTQDCHRANEPRVQALLKASKMFNQRVQASFHTGWRFFSTLKGGR